MMPIGAGMNAYTQLQAGLGALQRIEDVLALPTETPGTGPQRRSRPRRRSHRRWSSSEVDLRVPGGIRCCARSASGNRGHPDRAGRPSGAGKSTLLALAERFYDATAGRYAWAGWTSGPAPRATPAQLGYVEQEAPVLAGTIRDNLLLAAPEADEAALREVLATVNLSDLAERAPEGLDAQVGEGGVCSPAGNGNGWRSPAPCSPARRSCSWTSRPATWTPVTSTALRQAIDAASAQRTLIVVAHRLSTVVDADQIVVLDRGRVVAVGAHQELADTSPLYRELAAHQLLVT